MLHRLHRLSAMVIGAYVLVHLMNHLAALGGISLHQAFMDGYRQVYRQPLLEGLLFACLAFQVASGCYFVVRRWGSRHGFFERLQATSGLYLSFFIIVHVAAVLYGRNVLGLDTNFFYAAAGLRIAPFQAFFIPYYFLGVVAFAAHAACAFRYLGRERMSSAARDTLGYGVLIAGALVAAIVVATFSGAVYDFDIPAKYQATFR